MLERRGKNGERERLGRLGKIDFLPGQIMAHLVPIGAQDHGVRRGDRRDRGPRFISRVEIPLHDLGIDEGTVPVVDKDESVPGQADLAEIEDTLVDASFPGLAPGDDRLDFWDSVTRNDVQGLLNGPRFRDDVDFLDIRARGKAFEGHHEHRAIPQGDELLGLACPEAFSRSPEEDQGHMTDFHISRCFRALSGIR